MSKVLIRSLEFLVLAAGLSVLAQSDSANPKPHSLAQKSATNFHASQQCLIHTPSISALSDERDVEEIIKFYEGIIAQNDNCREQAIKKLGDLYHQLIFERYDEKFTKRATDFYTGVIQNHKDSNYLAESNLYLGKIFLYVVEPKDIGYSRFRLMVASLITTKVSVKSEAYYHLGRLHLENPTSHDGQSSYLRAKEYLMKAYHLQSYGNFGRLALELLQDTRLSTVK